MIFGDKIGELILDWDNEGSVIISSDFCDLDTISQLDALKDWISELTEVYDNLQEDCSDDCAFGEVCND